MGRQTWVLVMDPAVAHDLAPLGHDLGAPGEHRLTVTHVTLYRFPEKFQHFVRTKYVYTSLNALERVRTV